MRLTTTTVILRAIAEKLIPGLPYTTKVSILQQTSVKHPNSAQDGHDLDTPLDDHLSSGKTIFHQVLDSEMVRKETLREIASKS